MENNRFFCGLAVVFCVFLTGCAVTHPPSNWVPDPNEVPADVYGSWIEVNTGTGRINGELIAVSLDSMFVADSSLHGFSTHEVKTARAVLYNANDLWTAPILGPFLTISNGFYLVLTAPMWIIGGSIAASSRSYDPILDYPGTPLYEFSRYARFPRGLPPGIDRSGLKMKRVEKRNN